MNVDEKTVTKVGPGGYKCFCCGPAPKQRNKWRRVIRHRLSALTRVHIRNAIKEMDDDRYCNMD